MEALEDPQDFLLLIIISSDKQEGVKVSSFKMRDKARSKTHWLRRHVVFKHSHLVQLFHTILGKSNGLRDVVRDNLFQWPFEHQVTNMHVGLRESYSLDFRQIDNEDKLYIYVKFSIHVKNISNKLKTKTRSRFEND